MLSKSVLVIFMLVVSTVLGVGLALLGRDGWQVWLFWGSAQFLPVLYIVLAWWGSQSGSEIEMVVDSQSSALMDDQAARHV